jgi:hypothetical protein
VSDIDARPPEGADELPPWEQTAPEPGKKKVVPSWFRPGSKQDPDHPFAEVLQALSTLSGKLTRLFKTEQGKRLLAAFAEVAKIPVRTRFVAFTDDIIENGELFGGKAKFVGFHALRDLIKKAGVAKRPLSSKWLRAAFEEAVNATEETMLEDADTDTEGWE